MANAPSKTILIAAVVMALGGIVVVNVMQQRVAGNQIGGHDDEAEKLPENSKAATPAAPPVPASAPGDSKLAGLGESAVLGPKDAKQQVTIGWSWTPEVQASPGKVYQSVEALQKQLPNVRINVVNRDANPDVPEGISVGGKVIAPAAPDGSITANPADVTKALSAPASK